MIATENIIEKRRQVERIGVVFEKSGMSPVAARIIGLLMMAEPPYLTLEEITEAIRASKSSVSNALKFLQSEGLIEYITFSGDRRRYFQLYPTTWLEVLQQRIATIAPFREILLETVNMRSDQYPQFNQSLLDICDLYGAFEQGVNKIIDDWKKNNKQQ